MGSFPTEANSFSDSISRTDQALYKAKEEGRNRVVIEDED
jgi:PleD family two-component response regulator